MRAIQATFSRLARRGGTPRAVTIVSLSAGTLALCCLLGLGILGAKTRDAAHVTMGKAIRVAELRGTIAYLDKYLTMSARVAALSGDERWIRRYEEAEPRLDAAIDEAVALATPDVAAELSRTTDDANRRLVGLERESFADVRKGDLEAAWALLDSGQYAKLKGIYAEGIATFGNDLTALATNQTRILHQRAWLETCGLLLGGAILFGATVIAFHSGIRLRRVLVYTEMVARRDPLTGLLNRLGFREHLVQVLDRIRKNNQRAAILYLDLDGFKDVNDMFGHAAGDKLLCVVSDRLLKQVHGGDLVARLGGDEFAIIQVNTDSQMATALSLRVLEALRDPVEIGGALVSVTSSIGITLADATTSSMDELLREADIALYRAKAEGRDIARVFIPEMNEQSRTQKGKRTWSRQAVLEKDPEALCKKLVNSRH